MIVRDLGPAGRWFVVTVHYPSATMAKHAWERVDRKIKDRSGVNGFGILRLSPAEDAPGRLASGAPRGVHPVVAVTLAEAMAHRIARLLRDGAEWEPTPDFADAMILRRARVVTEHAGEVGRLKIRRPEQRGAQLDREGRMYEPPPGRG
jgi:hypothetical protein